MLPSVFFLILTVVCHILSLNVPYKQAFVLILVYTTSCWIQSDKKPTGNKQPQHLVLKKDWCFVSQPPFVWQPEPQNTSRQSQEREQIRNNWKAKQESAWIRRNNVSCGFMGWSKEYWWKTLLTNKMQIVIINNQTFITAYGWGCLTDGESKVLV